MSDRQETTDDIIREMRDFAEHRDYDSDGNMSTTALRVFADRFEAAVERETGNAAAMREALVFFVHDFASFREDVEHGRLHMMQCMDFIKGFIPLMESALSAPPRNCDRFATVDEAKAEWLRTNARLLSSTGLMPFESWLFSTAEGKEASNG